jgi:CDGSH-type Zn-finger protein
VDKVPNNHFVMDLMKVRIFLPQKVKLEDEKDVFFCGCKMSKNGAFCDGTHKDL